MFNLPAWPPKDYVLLPVPQGQQSSPVFTPLALPRSTQSNVGKYLYPVFYKDSEKVKPEIKDVHPTIIEKMLQKSRAWWIDKPGRQNFHNMLSFNKGDKNNPVYHHKEKVFNRPFCLETDCIEYVRLKKLQEKSDRECEAKCRYITGLQQGQNMKKSAEEALNIASCRHSPPFWWKDKDFEADRKFLSNVSDRFDIKEVGDDISTATKFWQETPNHSQTIDDPCLRRKELLMVGLPFRNEGCNWYYKNYPPPKITFKPQRVSK